MAAAKSLVNYFRDVCPHMLPKKYIGRFTEMDAPRELPVYGDRKINKTIENLIDREKKQISSQLES